MVPIPVQNPMWLTLNLVKIVKKKFKNFSISCIWINLRKTEGKNKIKKQSVSRKNQ